MARRPKGPDDDTAGSGPAHEPGTGGGRHQDKPYDAALLKFGAIALSKRLEGIVGSAGRAAVATDEENRIVNWNQTAADLLGYSPGEVIGRNLQDVIHARDIFGNRLCGTHCAFHEMVRLGEAPESFELDVFTATRDKHRVAVSVVIILGPDAQSYRLVYLMTPLRRRRRADAGRSIDCWPITHQWGWLLQVRSSVAGRKIPSLTSRQREVLALLVLGRNSREMAVELGVSVHTVRSHVQNVLKALEVSSRIEAVSKALSERVI